MSQQVPQQDLGVQESLGGFLARVPHPPSMATPHRHKELEFNLVMKGSAAYVLEDQRYQLGPGSLVWLFPGQPHTLTELRGGFDYWIGVFGTSLVRECAALDLPLLREARPAGVFCRTLSPESSKSLSGLFASLLSPEALDSPRLHRSALRHALLSAWTSFLAAPEEKPAPLHPGVEAALRSLRTSKEPLGLEELAKEGGLSAPYLSTLFRQQVGLGIAEFRSQLRAARFKELLREGSLTCEEASLEAGFGSYSQCCRVIRSLNGQSPRDWATPSRFQDLPSE